MIARLSCAWFALIALSATVCDRATAQAIPQIVPDDTLGLESSELIDESPTEQLIHGGAQRQGNLFHSFERFNIDAGQQVYFANPEDVVRIFSRVTGAQPSDILGTLGVKGSADLFLLNPNGILFGPNAQLDVAGSFTASTANSIVFSNGSEFSAVAPEIPLLNLNVPPGVQFNTQSQPNGNLTNEADLAVGEEQTLTLFGNSVLSNVSLAAPNGNAQILGNQIELIASATPGLSNIHGNTNLLVQAVDNITVADIADNTLPFAYGSGRITLEADANADGVGDVIMLDLQDTLQTNGRDLSISGIGLVLGNIDTSVIEHEIINIDAGGRIPETGTQGTVSFSFTVPEETGNINDLNVRFSAEHTYTGDLEVVLTSPDGTSLVLFSQVGGSGDNFQDTILDDESGWFAIDNSEYSTAPFDGRFHPQGTGGLAVFDGQPSGGVWTLGVTDLWFGDSGRLFQAGDNTAPWGTAQGTQLLLNVERDESGGAVDLAALGDVSVARIVTTSRGIGREGGAVDIKAGGDIAVATADTSTSNVILSGDGGAITLFADGSIDVSGGLNSFSISNEHEDISPYSGPSQSGNGGAITLSAGRNVNLNNGFFSIVDSSSYAQSNSGANISGNGGEISITADGNINVGGAISSSSSSSSYALSDDLGSSQSGSGGTIMLSAGGSIDLDGSLSSSSWSFSQSNSGFSESGSGGEITLSAGANIDIDSDEYFGGLSTFSSSQSDSSFGQSGNGGVITLSADGDIHIGIDSELDSSSSSNSGAGLVSDSGSNESGNGGKITITADGDIAVASTLSSYSSSNSSFDESGDGGDILLLSNSSDIQIANLSERFVDDSLISSFSYSVTGTAGNGGGTSLRAPQGSITGDGGRILTAAIAEASGTTNAGGNIYLEASSNISGLEILTLAGSGNSGDVNIQGRSDSLDVDNLRLITSGRIEIADPIPTVNQPPETITLNIDNLGQPGNTHIQNTGNIILNNVNIEASANGDRPAGGITVTSPGQLTFTNSQITSNANNTGDAGTIRLDVGQLNIGNGGRIFAATSSSGNGGSVIVNATDSVFLGEGVQDFEPVISVEASGAGRPGNIVINTPKFILSETASITATATETATNLEGGGSISLNADQMNLSGIVGIFAETQGQSPGGVLTLQPYQSNPDLDLTLASGAVVSASTTSSGNGGGLEILAPETISIRGPGMLAVETSGTGQGGDIDVVAQQLRLADRVTLSASTTGPGLAGDIELTLDEQLEINNSTVTSSTGVNSTGPGGNIEVTAPDIALRNGGNIAVNSQGDGKGGQVTVTGDQLILSDNSRISATTLSSDGGDLTFDLQEVLLLRGGSEISTTAGTAGAGGDGGDITIDTQFIVATPNENSDIVANAFDGDGGSVNITATGGLFGIEPRPERTPQNDITASSRNGVSGTITVQTPNINPSQDAVNLPTSPISSEVARSCREAYVQSGSEFVVTGRGGLPQGPLDAAATTLWQDTLPIAGEGHEQISSEAEHTTEIEAEFVAEPIVEVQGWTRNELGQVVLFAEDPQQVSVGQPLACHDAPELSNPA